MDDAGPLRDTWSHHNIRGRVLLLAGAGALASIALLGGTAWQGFSALDRRAARERERTAGTTARALDRMILEDLSEVARAASDPRMLEASPEMALTVLHELLSRAPTLSGALLLDREGQVSAGEPAAAILAAPAVSAAARNALGEGRPQAIGTTRPWLLALMVPRSPPQPAAIVVGLVDLRHGAWREALCAAAPDGGSAELGDAAGRLLVSSSDARLRATSAPDELRARAALSAAPMEVILHQPPALGGAELWRWRRRVAVLAPALFLLGLLFAWGAGRSLTAPLAVLTREAERIAGGDLTRPVPDLGPDQAGRLGRAFEAMRRALARDESRGRLLHRVIAAQEEERKRIARELHDDTCQALVVLGMRLDALRGACPGSMGERLAEARALAQRTTEGVHNVIFDLRPSVLDDLGLFAAIRWFATRHFEPQGISVRCEFEDPERRLNPEAETALFRAAQESLTNVSRHARAGAVLIRARTRGEELEIEIEDDGCGFEVAEVAHASPSGRGLGLLGIRERLQLLGGTARIESAPGGGTRVVLRSPVPVVEVAHG